MPSRPRRPGPAARSGLRRPARTRGTVRAGAPGDRPAVGLTTRAAVLGLVLCALVVSAALPLREYLAQRGRIVAAEQLEAGQRQRVAALEHQHALLQDPAHVTALARERLHYVKPGEITYRVLGAEPVPSPDDAGAVPRPAGPQDPWWSQLWGSVRAADGTPAR